MSRGISKPVQVERNPFISIKQGMHFKSSKYLSRSKTVKMLNAKSASIQLLPRKRTHKKGSRIKPNQPLSPSKRKWMLCSSLTPCLRRRKRSANHNSNTTNPSSKAITFGRCLGKIPKGNPLRNNRLRLWSWSPTSSRKCSKAGQAWKSQSQNPKLRQSKKWRKSICSKSKRR